MNERIRELIEKATVRGVEYRPGDDGHPTPTFYFDKEKFAELIIEECVSQCEKVASHADKMAKSDFVTPEGRMLNEGMWGGATNCGAWIKKHFGVE